MRPASIGQWVRFASRRSNNAAARFEAGPDKRLDSPGDEKRVDYRQDTNQLYGDKVPGIGGAIEAKAVEAKQATIEERPEGLGLDADFSGNPG